MRKLAESFRGRASQNIFEFKLIKREDNKAIYQKTSDFGDVYWDVMIIRVQEETKIGDSVIGRHEKMPSDGEYGVYGWSCKDFDKAMEYYDNITYEPDIT